MSEGTYEGLDIGGVLGIFIKRWRVVVLSFAAALTTGVVWLLYQKQEVSHKAYARLMLTESQGGTDILGSTRFNYVNARPNILGHAIAYASSYDFFYERAKELPWRYRALQDAPLTVSVPPDCPTGLWMATFDDTVLLTSPGGGRGTGGENWPSVSGAPAKGNEARFVVLSYRDFAQDLQRSTRYFSSSSIPPGADAGFSQPDILVISVVRARADEAVELATNIAKGILDDNIRTKSSKFDQSSAFIEKQLAQYGAELERISGEIRAFKQANRLGDVSGEKESTVAQLAKLDARVAEVKMERGQLAAITDWLDGRTDSVPGYVEYLISDPGMRERFKMVYEARGEMSTLEASLGERHPTLAGKRARLAVLEENLRRSVSDRLNALNVERESINAQTANYRARMTNLLGVETELLKLQRQRETAEDIYTLLTQKYEEINIERAGLTPDFTTLEVPTSAIVKVKRTHWKMALFVSVVLGLVLGVGLTLLFEVIDPNVTKEEQIERMGLRVLAVMPEMKGEMNAPATLLTAPDKLEEFVQSGSFAFESFRLLAMNANLLASESPNRTVMVSSTAPGEGKTTTVLNLAISVAISKRKTLLIDADLRNKCLTELIAMQNLPGIAELVTGKGAWSDVVHETPVSGLYIVPAGTAFADPLVVFSSERFRETLKSLLKEFDTVVLDTPPVLLADVSALAPVADCVLLVARLMHTNASELRAAADTLRKSGANLLGVVLNLHGATMLSDKRASYYKQYRTRRRSVETSAVRRVLRALLGR